MFAPLASRVRKSGTAAPGSSVCASVPTAIGTAIKRRQPRHRTVPSRPGRHRGWLPPPSTPATGRRVPKTVERRSALAWIRSTDRHPPAVGRELSGRLVGARPEKRKRLSIIHHRQSPQAPGRSSDFETKRAGPVHHATRTTVPLVSSVISRGRSSPVRSAAFSNRFPEDENSIRFPSSDHKGYRRFPC